MTEAYYQQLPVRIAQDNAAALVIVFTALMMFAVIWLIRRFPALRPVANGLTRMVTPAFVLAVNPPLSLATLLTGLLPMPRRALSVPSLVIVLLITALVRLPGMFQDLWFDEAFSARLAQMDFGAFWAATARDIHPPLYNLFLLLWGQIGGYSALWLRLPSFVFGLLSVALMYHVARALRLDQRTALAAALVVALMPSAVYYGTELRSYALMACIGLGLLLAVLKDRPKLFVALAVLAFMTHHYGLFYAAVMALAAFGYHRRRRWFFAGAAVAGAMVLWLPAVFAQSGAVSDGHWIYNSAGKVLISFVEMTLRVTIKRGYVDLLLPAALFLVGTLYLSRDSLRSRPALVWAALVFGVPMLAALVSAVYVPIYTARYLYPSMIGLAIPIAIAATQSRLLARVGLALALVGVVVGIQQPRTPFNQLISEHCANSSSFFHLTLESAFILSYAAPDAQHLVYPFAKDQGAVLEHTDIPIFGFQAGNFQDLEGRHVCVMSIDSTLSNPYERLTVGWLTRLYPYTVYTYPDNGFNYVFYEFEVRS